MDLDLSPQYVAFRDECRQWLSDNHPGRIASMDTAVGFEEHRAWEKVLFDAGWSVPAWPSVYGGRDCDLIEWLIYEEEYWLSGVPGRVSANGVSLLAPTIFQRAESLETCFHLRSTELFETSNGPHPRRALAVMRRCGRLFYRSWSGWKRSRRSWHG